APSSTMLSSSPSNPESSSSDSESSSSFCDSSPRSPSGSSSSPRSESRSSSSKSCSKADSFLTATVGSQRQWRSRPFGSERKYRLPSASPATYPSSGCVAVVLSTDYFPPLSPTC
ncbi:MAG: hypothetical protein F4Y83_04305, partial [Acidimicrobiia bacterium]|nr:hypothetical protein [Acidimicrobiia bacterium]